MANTSLDVNVQARVEIGELRKMEEALQRQAVRLRLVKDETGKLVQK